MKIRRLYKIRTGIKGFLIISMIVIVSCTLQPEERILQPSFDKILHGELLNIKADCINQLRIYDTVLLCVMNERCSEKAIHLYSLNSLELLVEFGRKGNGPEEFNLPMLMPSGSYPDGVSDSLSFWIQDINHKRLKLFRLPDVLKGKYLPFKTLFIEPALLDGYDLNFISKNKVIGEDHQMGKGLFFTYDLESEDKIWIDYFPEPQYTFMPKKKIPLIYAVRIGYNKALQSTVIAYRFFNRLGFYDKSNQLISNIIIGDPVTQDFSQKSLYFVPGNVKTYFFGLYVMPKYIYALMHDATQQQTIENPDSVKTKVVILDWDGKLISAFRLDRFIISFTIDEKNQCLYGVSNTKDGFSKVYKYKYSL